MNEENKKTGKEQTTTVKGDNKKTTTTVFNRQFTTKDIAQIVYVCQALSFFFGITAIVGVILNYLKRDDVEGTWLESHFVWQIRTFWIGLIASFIGFILIFILIGFLVLAVTLIWTIYRVVKGWILLNENKPIENYQKIIS